MRQIYFATTNKGKVVSLNNMLLKHDIEVIHVQLELPEPRSEGIHEIARDKVSFAAKFTEWFLNK